MEEHFSLSDASFAEKFRNCNLGSISFTHKAHLRLAWIYITTSGEQIAIDRICEQLKTYTASVGAEEKFNLTVTIAAIKAVNHFVKKSSALTCKQFLLEFPALTISFKDLIATHYSTDIFEEEKAKHTFMQPDLAPFS